MPTFAEMFRAMHYSHGSSDARAVYHGVEVHVGNDGDARVFIPIEGYGGGPAEVKDKARAARILEKLAPSVAAAYTQYAAIEAAPPSKTPDAGEIADAADAVNARLERELGWDDKP